MKLWKRFLFVSTTLLTMLVITAGVLPSRVSASFAVANLNVVRLEGRSLPTHQEAFVPAPVSQASTTQTSTVAQSRTLTREDFAVGGISLLSTEAQVRERLGAPESVMEDPEALIGHERYLTYNRNGIRGVQLAKESDTHQFVVFSILITDRGVTTPAGIVVGDRWSQLREAYGSPTSVEAQGDTVDVLYYSSEELNAYFAFTVLNGDRITEISLARINPLTSDTVSYASKSQDARLVQANRAPLSIQQVEIGSISGRSTEAQVRQELGTPGEVRTEYWGCCGNVRTLFYADSEVKLLEGEPPGTFTVFLFSTTRPDLATRDGVRPGDAQQKVFDTYGTPHGTRTEEGITTLFYSIDEYATSLRFHIRDGQVIAVSFFEELT